MLKLIIIYNFLFLIILNLKVKLLFYPIGIIWSLAILLIIFILGNITFYIILYYIKIINYLLHHFSDFFFFLLLICVELKPIYSLVNNFVYNTSSYFFVFQLKRFFLILISIISILTFFSCL